MFGQGSPLGSSPRLACWLGGMLCALFFSSATAEEPLEMRLRIAWGGGQTRAFHGEISLASGSFSSVVNLGLEADEPGSVLAAEKSLKILRRTPTSYDGLDVSVRLENNQQETLTVSLVPADRPDSAQVFNIPLRELVEGFHNSPLDEQGNRLLVRRVPGDSLRLKFDREHLVFAPEEELQISAQPHLLAVAAESSLRCQWQLLRARSSDELWYSSQDATAGAQGNIPSLEAVTVPIPKEEGVYDLVVTLTQQRLASRLVGGRVLATRKLQFVVVSPLPREKEPDLPWSQELEIDPLHPHWWDRLRQVPQLRLIPGFGREPLGNKKSQQTQHLGQPLVELLPQGWSAYPLPVSQPGLPHLIEIEYPADVPQTLSISVLEPNAAGEVVPIGLDSGFDVPDFSLGQEEGMQKHRLVFWPRTRSPIVLLANRRSDGSALHGKLRLLSGPRRLPPATAALTPHGRLLALSYEKPLFCENFGASEMLDPTGRSLDDWLTFYEGATRLVEYLKFAGYNGASIAVAAEGSGIYPSKHLAPSPKFDSGIFSSAAQDPLRKDVLELLLRLFDREGLRLLPAVQFATPLPELERLRALENAAGIMLADDRGETSVLMARYNPLDERVQTAMENVVAELAERYQDHPSFAGISLQLEEEGFTQLPGIGWGCDDLTIAQFEEELGVRVPAGDGHERRRQYLLGPGRNLWLNWRGAKIAELFHRLQKAGGVSRPLYVSASRLLTDAEAETTLRPKLPGQQRVQSLLLQRGLDFDLLADNPRLIVLRPGRTSPLFSLRDSAAQLEINRAAELDRQIALGEHPAADHYLPPLPLRLEEFDAQSPIAAGKTYTWLASHITPAQMHNRRRLAHSLAALDALTIFDGGWMASLGQEDATRGPFTAFCALPAVRFEDALAQGDAGTVRLRTAVLEGKTYLYAVNDSPWPAKLDVKLDDRAVVTLEVLGGRELPQLNRSGGLSWQLELEPYDIVAAAFNQPGLKIIQWEARPSSGAEQQLQKRIEELRRRALSLREVKPAKLLGNAGFEIKPSEQESIPAWIHAERESAEVRLDTEHPRSGAAALRLKASENPAWIRSEPFVPPESGRLSVWAWIKIEENGKQPPLRIAIEGRLEGEVYYRFAKVGAEAQPLQDKYAPYLFQIDDLPAAGLTDLRIGFDLMGPGEVWIDDVQLFDLWFYENERDELLKNIGVAHYQLEAGKVTDCLRYVEGYWPQFLLRHVPEPTPEPAKPVVAKDASPEIREAQEKSSWWQRIRPWR